MAPRNQNSSAQAQLITAAPEVGATNREQVEEKALSIAFSTEKSASLLDVGGYGSKAGAVSYSSVRAYLKKTEPKLIGAALTERVNATVNGYDATALAAVIQLTREGFKFQRVAGRELKSKVRTVSIKMSNGGDKADKAKAVKLEDMSIEALEAVLAARRESVKAEVVVDLLAA